MVNFSDYKSVSNESYIFVEDITKLNLDRKEMLSKTNLFKSIKENFRINIDLFSVIVEGLGIADRELFDYTISNTNNNILIAENAVFIEKWCNVTKSIKRTYYSVYICEHPYSNTLYSKIAEKLMVLYFAKIFNHKDFLIETPLPKLELISDNTMENILFGHYGITYRDFCAIQQGKTTKYKSKFHLYNDFIVLDLETINLHNHTYDYTLIIPYEVLHTKDWSLVENFKVHGIIKRDANDRLGRDNNNWFEEKQIDSPYWNNPLVNKLKDLIKSL